MNPKKIAALFLALCLLSGICGSAFASEAAPINRRVERNMAKSLNSQPEAAKARTDTLVIGVPDLFGQLNPFWADTTGDHYAASLLFDELLFLNNAGETGAGIASFTRSADGKTYTFTVKDGTRYLDGAALTSDDFINALYLLTMPGYDGCYDITRANIIGVEAYLQGEAAAIEGIRRINDRTFSVTLASANPDNLVYFAIPALRLSLFGDMRRPEAIDQPDDFPAFYRESLKTVLSADPTGMTYGQYALTSLEENAKAVFTKNDQYWRGAPYIGTVELAVVPVGQELGSILSGEVDIISMLGSVDAVDAVVDFTTGFINLYTWEGDVIGYLGLNTQREMFSDLRVRQALTVGFDREAARQKRIERYGVIPTALLFDEFSASAADMLDEQYPYDAERAAALLDEAGWRLESDGLRYKNGNPLAFTLTYNTPNPVMDIIVSQLVADYALLGVHLSVEAVPFDTLLARIEAGTCDMYFQARRMPASPSIAANLFAGDSHLNQSQYTSDTLDRFLAMADAEQDSARESVIYEVFFQELYMELPFIPLYRRSEFLLINARVMNVTVTTAHDITADVYRFFFTDTLEGQW